MLKSSLCDYNYIYAMVKETIITTRWPVFADESGKLLDERNKGVIFKDCTDSISQINNIQEDNAKNLDFVMPIHNLIEYNDSFPKTFGSL